jgi:uncharacterized membrane protein
MSTAFGICIFGLLLGLVYSLYESFVRHKELEVVLSRSIPYYKILGELGILGLLLFFAFLISLIIEKNHGKS